MSKGKNIEFSNTKLQSVYFHELSWLSTSIKENCEAIFIETKIPETGYLIQVSPDIHAKILTVLINAANIKKLIFTFDTDTRQQSKQANLLRKERSRFLKNLLQGIDLSEIKDSNVRNSIEHFDEYLDTINVEFNNHIPSSVAVYNMVLSHWEALSPRPFPLRLYISSEKKFYNMKYSIDIGKIYLESLAIIERLNSFGVMPKDGPGGLMIPLAQTNFQ